jgi:hypothetical protein
MERSALYEPLSKYQIRVLQVQSSKKLQFTFRRADLDQPPQYAAISYTWGDAARKHRISIDGFYLLITDNLFNALRTWAYNFQWYNLPFWADAICINQMAVDERNAQVPLMDKVYLASVYVYVSLGISSVEKIRQLSDLYINLSRKLVLAHNFDWIILSFEN